ncbi:PAS domain-containing sensor histidine kinase [Skermanella mucosa]|uniref:sensor histidine kinase n=1 Tax=Skermanella mucosa TaxID=1789672 RepID=UPI00192AFAE4|nr:PAS domain-containing sensor histidine kinase [Skermanella mucosa]UEM20062.1 PAS domain-containing sensor histidine kinase [Skermanella mucosa]
MNVDKPDLPKDAAAGNQSSHLWIACPDGSLEYVNAGWRRFAGRSASDMLGDGWQGLVHPDDLPGFLAEWHEARRSGSPLAAEVRLLSADGPARTFVVQAQPLTGEDGAIVNWHGINTAVPADSRPLPHAYEKPSEVMARVRTRMVASANHDLRQPLSALSFLSNSLAKRLDDPMSQDLLAAMGRAIQSMQTVVDGQLYFDQVDSGQVQLNLADHPVNASLVALANEFSPLAERKGLGFTLHPSSAIVRTDPTLLDTMLKNLVCNALRYTVEGRVVVGCRRQGDWLRIQVLDTGRGIAAEELGLIWQDFFRSSQSVREYPGGYGLGLSVVKRLAERLGHTVEVTTRPHQGSCFTLTLPLSNRRSLPAPDGGRATTRPLDGLRLLLLAGEAAAGNAIRLLVEEWGGTVRTVRTAPEAEKLLADASFPPDAIIADFRPGGERPGTERFGGGASGIFTMHKLIGVRGHPLKAPLRGFILSDEDGAVRRREIELAGYGMIVKPVDPEALFRALSQIPRQRP